jgi:hypothetical protein
MFTTLAFFYAADTPCFHFMLHFKAITFPECIEAFLQDCLDMINGQVQSLGLASIETVVHEKRNLSQPGYNKVVIITNKKADRVEGQAKDGIVTYPFLWDDALTGLKSLGVDGKWNCESITPEECCQDIKESMFPIHPTIFFSRTRYSVMYLINVPLYLLHWQALPPSTKEEITLSATSSSLGGVKTNPREMIAFSSNCRRMGECTKPRSSSKVRDPQGCQKFSAVVCAYPCV